MRLLGYFVTAVSATIALIAVTQPINAQQGNCDPSYPDVCIAPPPPDLDCGEINARNFRVVGSDPHRFDGDKDGVGCEE